MKRVILVSAAAVLALAGCSKSGETAKPAAVAKVEAPAAPAQVNPPTRKEGLWEQSISMPQMTQTTKMCLDAATNEKIKWWSTEGHGKSNCAEQSVTPTAGGWAFHSVCDTGDGAKVTSDGTATGDFGSHYKVDVTSVTSGSPMAQANGTHKIVMEATWKGPCPAGMKGGDIEMPGGMRISTAGGAAHMEGGPGGGMDMAKLRAQAMAGHMDPAEIAKMRAQAKAMEAAAKDAK